MSLLFHACHAHNQLNPQNYNKNVKIFLLWKNQGTSYPKEHKKVQPKTNQNEMMMIFQNTLVTHPKCCHLSRTIQSCHFIVTPRHVSPRFLLWQKSWGSPFNLWLHSAKLVDTYSLISTPITTLELQLTEIKKHKRGNDIFLRCWWKFSWQSVQNMLHKTVVALVPIINERFSRWLLHFQLTEVM